MFKNLFISILLLITCISVYAQTNTELKTRYKIIGKVIEASSDKSVPYAIIQVFNIQKQTETITATDALGDFILYVRTPGSYMLKFNAMGYGTDSLMVEIKETSTNVGQIKLSEGQLLKGVTVTAKRLIMKDEGDRLVYDVTNDPEAKKLKMSEIMRKIPFMSTDGADGKLKYLNNKLATILIDGMPNEMINGGRQFPMRLIKGDVMSKIEIILPNTKDNPGDKPILNIKLARELPDGYAAEISVMGNTDGNTSGEIDLITKFNELYISLTSGHDYQNKRKRNLQTINENMNGDEILNKKINNSTVWSDTFTHRYGFGATYNITKQDNISAAINTNQSESNAYNNTFSEDYESENLLIKKQISNSRNTGKSVPMLNGSLEYSHTRDIHNGFSLSYFFSDNLNKGDYRIESNITNFQNTSLQILSEQTKATDKALSYVFYKSNPKYGFRTYLTYTDRNYSNSSELEYWDDYTNGVNSQILTNEGLFYKQKIISCQGQFRIIKKNYLLSISLSADNVTNKGVFHSTNDTRLDYDEFKLYPGIMFSYRTKSKYRIIFKYNTNVLRPNVNYLNPFEDKRDPNNIVKGNPYLKSEYSHNLTLVFKRIYNEKFSFYFTTGVSLTDNAIESSTTINQQNISITTYENIGKKRELASEVSLSFTPFNWCDISAYFDFKYNYYNSHATNIKNEVYSFDYHGYINLKLSKTTNFWGNISVSSLGAKMQTKDVRYYTSLYLGLSQTLIKEKLFLSLSLSDPFKSHRYITEILGSDTFRITTKRETPSRVFTISLRWNFGRLKEKTEYSGNKTPASDLVRQSILPPKN